jgi:hypothetical protein
MDGQRFDEIARTLGGGTNRRRILRALGAVIPGGMAIASRAGSAVAQAPTVCFQDSDCIEGSDNPCSGASCVGGTCTFFIVDCIPGYGCCGNGECCPESAGSAACSSDADCVDDDPDPCTGSTCQNGTCTPYSLLCVEGFVCCRGECAESCDEEDVYDPHCGYVIPPGQSSECGDEGASVPSMVERAVVGRCSDTIGVATLRA